MREIIIYLISAFTLLLCGCSSKKYVEVPVPVEKVQYVDRYINKTDSFIKTDSVFFHDSVSVYVRGDTIYQDRWRYKDRIKVVNNKSKDTVLVTKIDSVPKIVYKYVEKESVKSKASIFKEVAVGFLLAIIFVVAFLLFVKQKTKQ